jgi:hypothetical protein
MDAWLRIADGWVTPERVRGYPRLLLALYGLALVALALSLRHGLDPSGHPLGADFIIFYAASSLALHGHAAAAYAPAALLAAERGAVAASRGVYLWCYPPSFQLALWPLALLPYRAALAAWLGLTGGLYLLTVRMISPTRSALILALAFPAGFLNLVQGQTGFLTAALLGGGLLMSERRPIAAGVVLGLLIYKPHFGVLIPLALAAGGRWRTVVAMGLSALALVGASAAAFGVDAWIAFARTLPLVSHNLASGALPLAKDPSVYAALRQLGAPQAVALGANLALALPVLALTLKAWRDGAPLPLRAGMSVAAVLIASPYAFDYDLAALAVPLGVLAQHLGVQGGRPGLRALVAAGFAAPFGLEPLSLFAHLQLAPLLLVALFAGLWRAAYADAPRRRAVTPRGGTAAALAG